MSKKVGLTLQISIQNKNIEKIFLSNQENGFMIK